MFHHGSGGVLAAAKPSIEALVAMGYAVFVRDSPRSQQQPWAALGVVDHGSLGKPANGPATHRGARWGVRRCGRIVDLAACAGTD